MTPEDHDEFLEVLSAVYQMYQKVLEPQAMNLMFKSLKRYSIKDVRDGLIGHMNNPDSGMFPPKVADVVRHIEGSSQSASGAAWAKVDQAIRCVGPHSSVVFDDPKIHAAIERLGGWIKVSQTSSDEYPFLQNNFIKLYTGFTTKPPEHYPRRLIGITDHHNEQEGGSFLRGKVKPNIVPIGDRSKCRLVHRQGRDTGVAQIHRIGTKDLTKALPQAPGGDQ